MNCLKICMVNCMKIDGWTFILFLDLEGVFFAEYNRNILNVHDDIDPVKSLLVNNPQRINFFN